jgi:hypothetical protein
MTGRYRRIPIEVDAKQLTTESVAAISAWLPARLTDVQLPGPGRGLHPGVKIRTLDKEQKAEWGDYVIRLGEGEFRICRRDKFELDYTELGEDNIEPGVVSRESFEEHTQTSPKRSKTVRHPVPPIIDGEKVGKAVAGLGRAAARFMEGMAAQSALAALLNGDTAEASVQLRRLSDDTLRKVSEAGAMLSVHALVVLNAREPAQPSDSDGE